MAANSKLLSIHHLQMYHESLMKHLQEGKLISTNICPNCGGILESDNTCPYCGAKFKMVLKDKGEE